jgi:solute carrier family 13 (sodium-dependent dicarboxylate transporter), member 2/3/5
MNEAPWGRRQRIGMVAGALAFALILLLPAPEGVSVAGWRVAAVGVLMAVWWMSEALPIPVTALLPLPLFPLLGVGTIDEAAAPFANPVIFLFLGGFCIAQAMQRWDLHRRIALNVIRLTGTRPVPLIGGFMVAAAFLSMWVSNTAVAVMMLPIGLSVVQLAQPDVEVGAGPLESNFGVALMLGIAYATSIGGIATLVGTPPNALLAGYMRESHGIEIGFGEWMAVGLPVTVLMLPVTWLLLTRVVYRPGIRTLPGGVALIARELEALGPRSRGENVVALVFAATAALWIGRPLLAGIVPGLSDAGIAIAAAIALFMIPVDLRQGRFALNWEWARRLPWDVLILFGGGLSLAAAISRSGLAAWIGTALGGLHALPLIALTLLVTTVILFMTELTSNTAAAATFLPILGALALSIGINPLELAVPAALAASCAFMLPVATPPNAIVYGSGYVTVPQMARAGVLLNVLFALAIPFIVAALIGVIV